MNVEQGKLTKRQLAERWKVDTRTISRFVVEGMPHTGARFSLRFDPVLVDEWHSRRRSRRPRRQSEPITSGQSIAMPGRPSDDSGISISEAERRKLIAEARQKELKLAKDLGQVISVADSARLWDERVVEARQALLNAPAKIVQRMGLSVVDSGRLNVLLTDEFAEILRGLAGE